MLMLPHHSLFSLSLILGTIISLTSSNWLMVWLGLELNLLSFIPLIPSAEASMKYFLAQVLGSGLILLSLILFSTPSCIMNMSFLPLLLGLLVKLGLPPNHLWYPAVMSLLSWPMCMILSTWQKLVPLILLFTVVRLSSSLVILLIIVLSCVVSGLGGLNQTSLRPLMAFSSIGHMAWMMTASGMSLMVAMVYMIFYMIISLSLMFLFLLMKSSSLLLNNSMSSSLIFTLSLPALLLSLGGVPPTLGFFSKWLVLSLISVENMVLGMVLITGAMMSLYYYLNILFINLISPMSQISLPLITPFNKFFLMFVLSTLTFFPAPLLI